MSAILVDYKKIIGENLKKKYPISKNIPNTNAGLVLLTTPAGVEMLKKAPLGEARVKMLEKIPVTNFYFVIYFSDQNTCLVHSECSDDIEKILPALFSGFPRKTKLQVQIKLNSKNFLKILKNFSKVGFRFPYLQKQNNLVLTRYNTPTEKYNSTHILTKISYILEQHKNNKDHCTINVRLSEQALRFLRKASKIGITVDNNGKKSQKELTGELVVSAVKKEQGKIIYIIGLDEGSVQSGEEENVDVAGTRYNFHSHPEEAYVRHSVDKAWPSVTDYLGYLQLGNNTIFHCVAALEGIYVLSFSPYWVNRLSEVSRKFIDKNYHIDHKAKYTPKEYIEKVNKILYRNHPIYLVKFFEWKNAGKVFSVSYKQLGGTCIPCEKDKKEYCSENFCE